MCAMNNLYAKRMRLWTMLQETHEKYCRDMRCGQFVLNFAKWVEIRKRQDLFYTEDKNAIRYLHEYSAIQKKLNVLGEEGTLFSGYLYYPTFQEELRKAKLDFACICEREGITADDYCDYELRQNENENSQIPYELFISGYFFLKREINDGENELELFHSLCAENAINADNIEIYTDIEECAAQRVDCLA